MQVVVDALPMLFFHKDTENRILRANKAVADLLGVTPEEMENTPTSQWYPDEAEAYYKDDLEVIRTGRPRLAIVEQLKVSETEKHWIRTDKFPHHDENGEVDGIVVFIHDLTADYHVREGDQTNDQKLRSILGTSPDVLFIIDQDGLCTELSGDEAVLGETGGGLSGKRVQDTVHGELALQLTSIAAKVCERGGTEEFEYSVQVGEKQRVYAAKATRFDREDRVGAMFACWDRTSANEREAELFETRNRLDTIVEAEPECVKVLSPAGLLIDMNPAGLRMVEADSFEQVRGRSVYDFVTPEHREAYFALHSRVIAGGSGVLEFEIEGLKGTRRWVETHAAPLRDRAGSQIKHIAITRDISEAKRAEADREALEAQVRHVQKLESIGVLAGGIAHDFSNHLTAILANADFALGTLDEGSVARESIDACIKSSKQAAETCEQLLTYAGRRLGVAQPTNLTDLVNRSLKLMKLSVSKRAELEVELAENLPAASVDSTQIQQLVINLVTNASEALNSGTGVIKVRTGVVDHQSTSSGSGAQPKMNRFVYIEVIDSGCGMSPETREKIFDPFFTTKFTGRGLGLATVAGTARGHEGFIDTESMLGLGTRIRVHFPVVAELAVEPKVVRELSEGNLSGTILIVDDDSAVREVVERILEYAGIAVMTAESGTAALELFATHSDEISAVVLDHTMPGMVGTEVCDQLRQINATVPVLFSSGHPEEHVLTEQTSTGPMAFLKKPFRPAELLSKLEELVSVS